VLADVAAPAEAPALADGLPLGEPPASADGGLPLLHAATSTIRAELTRKLAAFRFMDSV
jgi:hypothetical protein